MRYVLTKWSNLLGVLGKAVFGMLEFQGFGVWSRLCDRFQTSRQEWNQLKEYRWWNSVRLLDLWLWAGKALFHSSTRTRHIWLRALMAGWRCGCLDTACCLLQNTATCCRAQLCSTWWCYCKFQNVLENRFRFVPRLLQQPHGSQRWVQISFWFCRVRLSNFFAKDAFETCGLNKGGIKLKFDAKRKLREQKQSAIGEK